MKILCIIPPYIPSYFNAGHHLPIFLVAAYLRSKFPYDDIKCLDFAALNFTWKEVCDELVQEYEVIVLLNDFDAADTFQRFLHYKEMLSPNSKTITFGRLSKLIPGFFLKLGFDAVLAEGDYESGVFSYLSYLKGEASNLPGIKTNDTLLTKGIYLEPDQWVLPDVTEIPYEAYNFMYKNDLNKFCGIPSRQELVIPLARGCPVGCAYCDVPPMQGKIERRLSVVKVINYICESFKKLPFDYVTFYAPTFTLNRKWVIELCEALLTLERKYPWKCVTVLKMLDERLITLMAKSGCVRISLGIESFTRTAAMGLPKLKQETLTNFKEVAILCQRHGIELNCFIMLGLPEDTPHDVANTIDVCLEHGARVRPTIYTPYHLLRDDMTIYEIQQFNRQLFPQDYLPLDVANKYYQIFYNNLKDRPTDVAKTIPHGYQEEDVTIF